MAFSPGPVSDLPQQHAFVTGHNEEGKAIVHNHQDLDWKGYDDNKMGFSVVYTTSEATPDLNDDKDITTHKNLMQQGELSLVNPNGSVLRYVDFSPGYSCEMHRTQSLDYGIVLEGNVEMVLDSGEKHQMKKGDVAVQRATEHQWVNASKTEWARMVFVLQDCKPVVVGGKTLEEDLGSNLILPAAKR
jgi:quercetin dioxygenase-like cupin family protein